MNNNKSNYHNFWKYTFTAPLLFGFLLVISIPIHGQNKLNNIITTDLNNKLTKDDSSKGAISKDLYKSLYILIDDSTTEEVLRKMEQMLKQYGVDFTIQNARYNIGKLKELTVSIDIPGLFKGEKNISDFPIIIFQENQSGFGEVTNVQPTKISTIGKSILSDNLNGALIYQNDKSFVVIGSGSFQSH